uniref:Uncharacterized protein n=1 Tax=Kalanchoe fedtschenkoi TaxID=63787 RepID=A0A7N0UYQ3_KALFE
MGRGRVQLKRIENKINRQVTFSKRRSGLMKKAHEISVLCEAEVALIVYSTKGKLFDYASDSSMERILERYERYSTSDQQLLSTDLTSNGSWTHQHAKLQNRIEVLQRNQRNLMGEDLDPLSLRELQNLEHQLENALKHIRLKKNQLMNQSIAELHKKDKAMQEQNNLLGKKIKEREKALAEHGQLDHQSQDPSPPPTQTLEPIMRCVDINRDINQGEGSTDQSHPSTALPPWMLGGPTI